MKNIIVGLTGNMGSGKSTVAQMIKKMGIAVFDADAGVHALMESNKEMALAFERKFPNSISARKKIKRSVLAKMVAEKQIDVRELERIIFPFLRHELDSFLLNHKEESIVILEAPLLFEAGWDTFCNKIIVVTAPEEILKKRVMERSDMTEKKYAALTERQIDNGVKISKSDYVIDTNTTKKAVKEKLAEIMEQIIECAKLS